MRTYCFDIECTNLRSDIGTLTIACFGELDSDGKIKKLLCNDILQAKGEKNLVKWVATRFKEGDIFIGQNSVSFDKNFISG